MKTQPPSSLTDRPTFDNRVEAGRALALALEKYAGSDALVLGIPRGGVPVAAEVACILDAELDVIVARKLGAPFSPELAIGAVTADGERFLNASMLRDLSITESYLQSVTADQQREAQRREVLFRGGGSRPRILGRVAIIVDDGLATEATMQSAVWSVRRRGPSRLIVAVPVGSQAACAALSRHVDELICLSRPEPFYAVGYHYAHFDPVEDSEVVEILRKRSQAPREISETGGGS